MTAGRATRRAWPIAIGVIVAIVAVSALVAAIVLLGRPAPSASEPSPLEAASHQGHAASSEAEAVLDASSFSWVSASQLPPPDGRPLPVSYALQGGTFADERPPLDLVVPYLQGAGPNEVGRVPVTGEPAGGAVVYVADDGSGSQVRRATLSEPIADQLVLELDEIVWTATVTPDGSHAYLLLVARDQPVEAGVIRVALDGSGAVEEVLQAAETGGAGGIRPVAIAGFRATLMLSIDGRHLLRRVCSTPERGCTLDVLDIGSGDVLSLPDREVIGIEAGIVFWSQCLMDGCRVAMTELEAGEDIPLGRMEGVAVVATSAGRPVIVHATQPVGGQVPVLRAIDAATGDVTELLRSPVGGFVELHSNAFASLKVSGPAGWVVVTLWDALGNTQRVAVDVADGTTVPLPAVVTFGPVPAGGVDG